MYSAFGTCSTELMKEHSVHISAADRTPPHVFFVISAVFHYLGPAFAVLLFHYVEPQGVAWLRISTAAVALALWRRPWRRLRTMDSQGRITLILLGLVLAAMNVVFYEAIDRLPLGTVGAIEFLGPLALAAVGLRTRGNVAALSLAAFGVYWLTEVRLAGEPAGYVFAFANCALFVLYVVLGHRVAASGDGIDRLAAAMLVASVAALPFGIHSAGPALVDPVLLAAAIGVGISSSVIPYVCDQLALARLPRATFALMLSLLPATASVVGLLVLRQIPSAQEVLGVVLVVVAVAIHSPEARKESDPLDTVAER